MNENSRDESFRETSATRLSNRSDRLLEVDRLLEDVFGRPQWRSHGPPLEELVATVLSQHTSDLNTAKSFASLRSRFPSWKDVVEAPTVEVAVAIRSGGLAEMKAPRIQLILRKVHSQTGDYSLDWLKSLPLAEAREWLLALPGVGPKTAACVLLFSLGLPSMPVDTHVQRVSRRLGFVESRSSAESSHEALNRLIGPDRDRIYALHMNLIRHGRETCRARRPACSRCCLVRICPSAFQTALDAP